MPPLYYGVGGAHTGYPWTIMALSSAPLADLLQQSLQRLSDFGVRMAVLFTGHFAAEQVDLISAVVEGWAATESQLQVLGLSVNQAAARLAADHAGRFESSLLSAVWPDLVRLQQLPPVAHHPAQDPGGDVFGAHRHDPTHPLYGVFGPDPRLLDPSNVPGLLEDVVSWAIGQVEPRSSERTGSNNRS
jgi:creatinine amidohydrolase